MTLGPLLALALLAPAAALAASSAGANPPATPGKRTAAPAAKPAPAKPAPASPAPAKAGTTPRPEVGGFVGYETADFAGPSLRLDGELPVRELPRQVRLSLVGSAGYSRLSWDAGFGVKGTANVFKLVPAARFTLPLAPRLSGFADAGVGLAHVRARIDFPPATNALGYGDVNDSTTNLILRLGVGAWYQLTDRVKAGALLELDPILGDFGFRSSALLASGSQTTFLLQVGLMIRL
jgi:opacity protein-like surface antigen